VRGQLPIPLVALSLLAGASQVQAADSAEGLAQGLLDQGRHPRDAVRCRGQ